MTKYGRVPLRGALAFWLFLYSPCQAAPAGKFGGRNSKISASGAVSQAALPNFPLNPANDLALPGVSSTGDFPVLDHKGAEGVAAVTPRVQGAAPELEFPDESGAQASSVAKDQDFDAGEGVEASLGGMGQELHGVREATADTRESLADPKARSEELALAAGEVFQEAGPRAVSSSDFVVARQAGSLRASWLRPTAGGSGLGTRAAKNSVPIFSPVPEILGALGRTLTTSRAGMAAAVLMILAVPLIMIFASVFPTPNGIITMMVGVMATALFSPKPWPQAPVADADISAPEKVARELFLQVDDTLPYIGPGAKYYLDLWVDESTNLISISIGAPKFRKVAMGLFKKPIGQKITLEVERGEGADHRRRLMFHLPERALSGLSDRAAAMIREALAAQREMQLIEGILMAYVDGNRALTRTMSPDDLNAMYAQAQELGAAVRASGLEGVSLGASGYERALGQAPSQGIQLDLGDDPRDRPRIVRLFLEAVRDVEGRMAYAKMGYQVGFKIHLLQGAIVLDPKAPEQALITIYPDNPANAVAILEGVDEQLENGGMKDLKLPAGNFHLEGGRVGWHVGSQGPNPLSNFLPVRNHPSFAYWRDLAYKDPRWKEGLGDRVDEVDELLWKLDEPRWEKLEGKPRPVPYSSPIWIRIGGSSGKTLRIVSKADYVAMNPAATELNVDYLLHDPFDFQQYKGLHSGQAFVLGYGEPGRFKLPRTVSGKHLMVTQEGDQFWLQDLGSTNGSRLMVERASQALSSKWLLTDEDRLRVFGVEDPSALEGPGWDASYIYYGQGKHVDLHERGIWLTYQGFGGSDRLVREGVENELLMRIIIREVYGSLFDIPEAYAYQIGNKLVLAYEELGALPDKAKVQTWIQREEVQQELAALAILKLVFGWQDLGRNHLGFRNDASQKRVLREMRSVARKALSKVYDKYEKPIEYIEFDIKATKPLFFHPNLPKDYRKQYLAEAEQVRRRLEDPVSFEVLKVKLRAAGLKPEAIDSYMDAVRTNLQEFPRHLDTYWRLSRPK